MDRDFIRKDLQQYLSFQKWVIKTTFMVVPLAKVPQELSHRLTKYWQ